MSVCTCCRWGRKADSENYIQHAHSPINLQWHFAWSGYLRKWLLGVCVNRLNLYAHSASRLHVLCIRRSYSADLGCCQIRVTGMVCRLVGDHAASPWSPTSLAHSNLSHQRSIFLHTTGAGSLDPLEPRGRLCQCENPS